MTWAFVAAGVATAAAAGISYYNTERTEHKQDQQLAAQLRNDAAKQRMADQRTAQLIQQQAASNDSSDKANSLAKFTQAIQQTKGNANRPLQAQGAVSDAYKKAGSDAALGIANYAGGQADMLSSIDAPQQQRQRDQFAIDRYKNDIDQIGRFTRGDDFLAQMRLRNIRRNPWLDAASSVLSSYGKSSAGGGGASSGAPDAYQGWLNNDPTYAGPY